MHKKRKKDFDFRYSKKKVTGCDGRTSTSTLTDEFGLEILNSPREMLVHSPTTTATDPPSNSNSTNHKLPLWPRPPVRVRSYRHRHRHRHRPYRGRTSWVGGLLRIRSLASFHPYHLHLWSPGSSTPYFVKSSVVVVAFYLFTGED